MGEWEGLLKVLLHQKGTNLFGKYPLLNRYHIYSNIFRNYEQ